MRFNIVRNEGEDVSVTVFFTGTDNYIATKGHPGFSRIVAALRDGDGVTDAQIRGMFDVVVPISKLFTRLSDRVSINAGRLFLDGDEVDSALTQVIARFFGDGHDDFMPLVNFMEKIETNPNAHSRENLFRWLRLHNYAICPDGDFIAYKKVESDHKSVSSGEAIVNGVLVKGRIPNQRDTIVEMPRSKVQHNPSQGCSTGLHVGNWAFVSSFQGSKILRIKINPRDVVSVPTENGSAKMRVCRYRVLDAVTQEDKTALFVVEREALAYSTAVERKVKSAIEAEKPKVQPKGKTIGLHPAEPIIEVVSERAFPEYYEQFTRADFDALGWEELRWAAKEMDVAIPAHCTRVVLTGLVVRAAKKRLKAWPSPTTPPVEEA